jgi:hypothetical protein
MGKTLDIDDVAATSETAKAELQALREQNETMKQVLQVTKGNILSIKNVVGYGVIAYDIWLQEVNRAIDA